PRVDGDRYRRLGLTPGANRGEHDIDIFRGVEKERIVRREVGLGEPPGSAGETSGVGRATGVARGAEVEDIDQASIRILDSNGGRVSVELALGRSTHRTVAELDGAVRTEDCLEGGARLGLVVIHHLRPLGDEVLAPIVLAEEVVELAGSEVLPEGSDGDVRIRSVEILVVPGRVGKRSDGEKAVGGHVDRGQVGATEGEGVSCGEGDLNAALVDGLEGPSSAGI